MPLPLSLAAPEAAIRAFIRADVRTAWLGGDATKKIYDDPPEVPAEGSAALPRAFVLLAETSGFGESESGGVNAPAARYTYEITLQKAKPATNTLHAARVADVDALLALLTANPTYHGYYWPVEGLSIEFRDRDTEAASGFYSITVVFTVEG
jgi:hypothetical protein